MWVWSLLLSLITNLIAKTATKCLAGGYDIQCGYIGQRGDSHMGRTRWRSKRFYSAPWDGRGFKTYKFLISEIFHLIFSDCR